MAEGQEDLLQELMQAYYETVRILRSLQRGGRSVLSMLSRAQQKRILIERGNETLRWNENLRDATQDMSPAERSQLLERHADVALQNDALEQQRIDLEARNQELRRQNEAGEQRLADQDAQLNGDRDRDGIPDDIENRTDFDRDHRDDETERRDEIDQQNDDDNDRDGNGVDDGVEGRERQQAEADEERRRQQEQDRQRDEQRGDGIDPSTVAETAAVAALADAELDRADQDRANDLQRDLDENGDRVDPATANELETDDAERGQVDPNAAAQEGLDADDRQQQTDLGPNDRSQEQGLDGQQGLSEQQGLGEQRGPGDQQPAADLDASAGQDSPGVTNEQDGSHLELNSDQEWDGTVHEVGEEGTSLNVHSGEQGQQSGLDADGPDQSRTESSEAVDAGSIEGQTFTVGDGEVRFADQDGRQNETANSQQGDLAQNPEASGPGRDEPAQQPQGVDGQQPSPQADDRTVEAPGAQPPGAEGPQADAPQVDAEQGQAPEQGANQVPQVKGPDVQQVANASQNAVEETAGEQGTNGQVSEAPGTQWRPPEDPAIAEARAGQPNGQRSGPSQDLPPDEQANFENIRGDQELLSSVKVDSAAVATSDRPGTPAAQRDQNLNRGGRGQGENGGRGRGE